MGWFKDNHGGVDPTNHLKNAQRLAAEGQYSEAIAELKLAARIGPNSAEPHMIMGSVYVQSERWADAHRAYSRALELDAQSWQTYKQLGIVYDRQGKFVEAIKMFMKAISFAPKNAE